MDPYLAACEADGDDTLLRLRLVPRAARTRIAGLHADMAKLRVKAPPVGGKANATALDYLADVLGLGARDLRLVRGGHSRTKVVRVVGLRPDDVAGRLAAAE